MAPSSPDVRLSTPTDQLLSDLAAGVIGRCGRGATIGSTMHRPSLEKGLLLADAGSEGNEILTSAAAAVLTVLLLAEGVTILRIGGLLTEHMFIGLVLIPPLLVKLGSTGYRAARFYAGSRTYREKGPPRLPLRLLAPVFVLSTVLVFVSGVWMLLLGHSPDQVLLVHQTSFYVAGVLLAVHVLAYAPRALRALRGEWGAGFARRRPVPGAGLRGLLVASGLGAGVALALSMLSLITGWGGGHNAG
jgi:hypothetical protein